MHIDVKSEEKALRNHEGYHIENIRTDHVKGLVRPEEYTGTDLNLVDWELTEVLDNVILCEYVDCNEDNTAVKRGGIYLPLGLSNKTWRVAKVHLAGPNCKRVKVGDHVIFPSTFGLQAKNVNNLKHSVFLSEDRIFGITKPRESVNS